MQDVSKYGGYTSLNPSYFIFIEHGPEKKRKRCFEVIQSYYSARIKTEKDLIDFLVQKGYKNPRVINAGIKKNALIKYKILCDIVQYTSFQRGVFSLKVLGGPKEVGRIRISGNMTEAKECKLINYSITGMYKTEMDLLKK